MVDLPHFAVVFYVTTDLDLFQTRCLSEEK